MSDRLTQLQICIDQLVEQFNAAVNYVNTNSEQALLDDDPTSVTNIAASAPLPGLQQQPQKNSPADGTVTAGGGAGSGAVSAGGRSDHPSARAEMEANFDNTINELSTDIILKSRQISMLIDSLPGVGVSEESQLELINRLSVELNHVEETRIKKIQEKDELLRWCESLILDLASGISKTK